MRQIFIRIFLVVLGMGMAGCNKKACERFCACEDLEYDMTFNADYYDGDEGVTPDDPDCYDACREELREASLACRGAFRRAARCLDKTGCDEYECEDEFIDAELNCLLNL